MPALRVQIPQVLFGAWAYACPIDATASASLQPQRLFPGLEDSVSHIGLKANFSDERLRQVISRIAAQVVTGAAHGTPKDFEALGLSYGDLHRFATFEAICAPRDADAPDDHDGLYRPLVVATVDSAVTCANVAIEFDGAAHPPVRKDRVFFTLNVHAAVIIFS